jgi:hypothetical protein
MNARERSMVTRRRALIKRQLQKKKGAAKGAVKRTNGKKISPVKAIKAMPSKVKQTFQRFNKKPAQKHGHHTSWDKPDPTFEHPDPTNEHPEPVPEPEVNTESTPVEEPEPIVIDDPQPGNVGSPCRSC